MPFSTTSQHVPENETVPAAMMTFAVSLPVSVAVSANDPKLSSPTETNPANVPTAITGIAATETGILTVSFVPNFVVTVSVTS